MKPKKAAVAVAISLLALHLCVLGLVRNEYLRTFGSNLIQIACGWTACGFALWTAARSRGLLRTFWVLVGSSYFMWGLGQSGWSYYESLIGPRQAQDAPTDLFFFFSFTPMLLALLLRKEPHGSGRDWARVLDAAQVGILAIAGYLFFFVLPAETKTSKEFTDRLLTFVFTSRNVFIGALFLVRSALAANRNGRRLYGWLALFWIFYSSMTGLTNYARLHFGAITGQWWDLGWTTPFLLAVLIAGNWEEMPGPSAFEEPSTKGLRVMASAYFLPTIVPVAIVLMAGRVTARHFYIAYGAILASFICYSVRLAVTQHRLSISSEAVDVAEARFRALFSQNPQPIWVFDLESLAILEVNLAAEREYGYSREEFLRMRVSDLRVPEEVPELMEFVRSRVPGSYFRAHHRRKDGSALTVQVSAQAMEFAGRVAEIEIVQNVSEKLALEEQLRQSQKMEAVGTLAGGVAHDFNNLLTVITGFSKLLMERFASDVQATQQLQQINTASERAAVLTRQLLAFSRRQVLQPTRLDLNEVIKKISERNLRLWVGPKVEIRTQYAPYDIFVKVDHGQIEQVIMNLAENAADAMVQGGSLAVETSALRLDMEKAQTLDVKPGAYATVCISDTGVGMSKETQSHIFEPFFSTKTEKGNGLGLSTVYGIVRQSEGAIEAESQPGKGSNFRVYLPLLETLADVIKPMAQMAGGGNETILLVEDDADLRDLSRRVLTMNGYRVLPASHGRDALRVAAEHVDEISLMVTDVIMPGMTGGELADRLHTTRPAMKVLFVSGYTDNIIAERGMLTPGTAFLQKPFSPRHLAAKVREVLDGALQSSNQK
jgi:PAS domain S-box-containing protein